MKARSFMVKDTVAKMEVESNESVDIVCIEFSYKREFLLLSIRV